MKKLFILILTAVLVAASLFGCSISKEDKDKVKDLEFTVVEDAEVPEELMKLIEAKKQSMFKLTYTNDQALYIVVGYGKQETGGYSISVNELFLTDNSIVIKTNLIGPSKEETPTSEPSFPYVVVKTELNEHPVIFQ